MTEEQVTKKILQWLLNNKWEIISYDFPQSGTGKYLHPNQSIRDNQTKNLKAFIPDIVAIKDDVALFFENKNRFFLDDFRKLNDIKTRNSYSEAISKLLSNYSITELYYGIGAIRNKEFLTKMLPYTTLVDFIILVDKEVSIEKDDMNIF